MMFHLSDFKLSDLQKNREEMDNFNIISYFSMALNAEFHVIHISFKTNTFLVE